MNQKGYMNIDFGSFMIALGLISAIIGGIIALLATWLLPILWTWVKPFIHALTG